MQLRSISIDPQAIILKVVANEQHGDSQDVIESKITAEEAPLPEFTAAFAKLPAVYCEIMEHSEWAAGLSIVGLSISRTKAKTRSVILHGKKQLELRKDFLHPVQSPMVRIDDLAEGESGPVKLSDELVEIIEEAITQAERYMNGERSQQRLDFDKAKAGLNALADKGRDDAQQSFELPESPETAKRKGKKETAAV